MSIASVRSSARSSVRSFALRTAVGAAAALATTFAPRLALAAATPVPYVDLSRYVGDWYQIAHVPLWFEFNGPCACARQRLAPGEGGAVSVWNTCDAGRPGGSRQEIRGFAYNDDPKSNAKFTVDFGLPFKGTYWIVGLDEDYRFAVVTDRREVSLYVLSKTPSLDPELYRRAVDVAKSQGLNVARLSVTEQAGCQYP